MKPDFFKILSIDSSRATADLAVEAVSNVRDYFEEVMNICLKEKAPLNWRAARVIALCSSKNFDLFLPYADKIAQLFVRFENDGLKRIFAGLLSEYAHVLNGESQSILLDSCFKIMLSDEKIAVKYNAMKLLYKLSEVIPEIKGELSAVIDFNISEGIFRFNGEIKRIYKAIDVQIQ